MIEALVDEGYYPMELTLLQETSITLTELDSMDQKRKEMYYYYILFTKKKEFDKMHDKPESIGKGGRPKTHMEFPKEFVSQVGDKK